MDTDDVILGSRTNREVQYIENSTVLSSYTYKCQMTFANRKSLVQMKNNQNMDFDLQSNVVNHEQDSKSVILLSPVVASLNILLKVRFSKCNLYG